ncbi:hypothetical protein FA10DRAFT_269569 [Acaromyces ingoldii]|uniref:DUF4267 domain-containing protein n=1 Tax=Acaromyces ingoldii TaxID=215250 RepID=A0A316YDK8_9BASI|nr:hypothetical protein FA10DRAFT_269569 [Acaromyces ingoldii]PWN86934.1 hypothetical protein FA10DRAFT_269569 [Acaromyces ingoldii]
MLRQASLAIALACCGAIVAIGARFLLLPQQATAAFGVTPGNIRALTAIKGVRDITSGIVPLVAWSMAGPRVFGWSMLAASLTPVGDAIIVITNGGELAQALTVHGATAAVLIATSLVLIQT